MRRVVVHRAGGYEQLKLEEAPDPRPGPGEVCVRAEAIGVNYADCVVRMGLYASAKKFVGWPITPGFEVAGRVVAVGEGVDEAPSGPVCAVTRFGGYSTHVVVPRHQVFPIPKGWSVEQSAGFPTVHLTAWYALRRLAHVQPGERVLVHSAAGGVGGALLQQLRALRARPVGVVGGAHKVESAIAQGAEAVVDKSSQSLWAEAERHAPEGYDVVLDANGYRTLKQSFDHLAPGGRLVVYGFHSMLPRRGGKPRWRQIVWGWLRTPRFNPLDLTTSNRSVLAFNLSFLFHRRDVLERALEELLALELKPPPVQTYAFDDVAAAHRALESGRTVGKLVLMP